MWKKFISCVLVIVMILGTVPYSTVYAESLSNASAEDSSSVQNIDEHAEQPSTSEENEENTYFQDDSASENIDNSETAADSDDNDDEEMIEQPVPKCAFSFDTPLMRAADANVLKSGSDTTDIEITRFDISLSSGAEKNDNGDYVWTAKNSDSGHPFIFRINYALSGTFDYAENEIQFSVPASVLLNRNGQKSNQYSMSVPHKDDEGLTDSNYFVYEEQTDENGDKYLVIFNRLPVPAAQSGYIEVAYLTAESTYEYADYNPNSSENGISKHESNPFYADISIQQNEVQKSQSSNKIPVCIDTSSKIASTVKSAPKSTSPISNWQNSWGTKPDDADNYYYLIWEICTKISPCTQTYDFSLVDSFNVTDGEVVGYKMQGQSSFTSADNGGGVVKNIKEEYVRGRYDYVLTRHSKEYYNSLTKYTVKNSVTATVSPVDKIDDASSKTSSASWSYERPYFHVTKGNFYAYKWGLNYNNQTSNSPDSPRRFDLDAFKSGDVDVIDNLAYFTYVDGYPYYWTVPEGMSKENPENYGKEPVTFELTDNELYLKALGQDYPTDKLTKDDYQFDKIQLYWSMNDAVFDDDSKEFKKTAVNYTSDDIISVYAKFDDDTEWIEIGSYDIYNSTFNLTNEAEVTYGVSASGHTVEFENSSYVCTGYRLLTSNKHYYTKLGAYPYVTLKDTDTVNNAVSEAADSDNFEIALKNTVSGSVYDGESVESNSIYNFSREGTEYVVGINREGNINKNVEGYSNDNVRRRYSVTWSVNADESYMTDGGVRKYVTQKSGRFYDLLPAGAVYKEGSLSAFADNTRLSLGQYSVNTILNYNGSGRTMLVVDYDVSADMNYKFKYTTLHSWESIIDYGINPRNSVAYETGNTDIGDGRPDDGGNIKDKGLMKDLDSETDDKKFIYAEKDHEMAVIMQASTGLDQKVMALGDSGYSYKTHTYNNSQYSYNYRYATDDRTESRDIVLFNSFENYETIDGKTSDWHGTFEDINLSQVTKKYSNDMVPSPVVYCYCGSEILDFENDNNRDLENSEIWTRLDEVTDRSKVKAIAVDLSKNTNGDDFVLPADSSLSIEVFMRSPSGIASESTNPVAYNNLYRYATETNTLTGVSNSNLIHHDYTELSYRVVGDLTLNKRDSTNTNKPVEGISFRLWGTSFYGTNVDITTVTSSTGNIYFNNLERGTYSLQETDCVDDYQADHNLVYVTVDENGKVELSNYNENVSKNSDGSYTVLNEPRIHGDLAFVKKGTIDGSTNLRTIQGAEFRLSGTSAYGNEVDKSVTSESDGTVSFKNIELGTYTLNETKAADGYILSKTVYSVVVDANGSVQMFDSDGDKISSDDLGDYYIINESLHKFKLFKKDAVNNAPLEGAKFELEGTSDYGTYEKKAVTTNISGIAEFTGLEPGRYSLVEKQAPEHHKLDETARVVTINPDGTVTIDGLTLDEDYNWFTVDNERVLEGVVTVTKIWQNDDESDRSIPVFHLDSQEPKHTIPMATISKSVWSANVNNNVADSTLPLRSAVSFTRNTELTFEEIKAKNAVKIDDGTTDYSVYFWKDDTTNEACWWSDADIVFSPADCSYMFYGCNALTSLDISDWNTVKATDMKYMFYNCSSLTTLNVTNFDTSSVQNMAYMFGYCKNLTSLDVNSFDTSRVSSMEYMFYYCSNLSSLDLSSFDTSKVTTMMRMFEGCGLKKIIGLDSGKFDTSNVTEMFGMFAGFKGTELDLSSFDTSSVTRMGYMFYNCPNLAVLDISSFNTSQVTSIGSMFENCTNLVTIYAGDDWSVVKKPYAYQVFAGSINLVGGNGTVYKGWWNNINGAWIDGKDGKPGLLTYASATISKEKWIENVNDSEVDSIKSLRSAKSFTRNTEYSLDKVMSMEGVVRIDDETTKGKAIYYWKEGDNAYWWSNAEYVCLPVDSSSMFFGCNTLNNVDLTGFDTRKTTDMNAIFSGCTALTDINLTGLDTSNVTDMSSMFSGCSALTGLNVTDFITSKVKDMSSMFSGCSSIAELDISRFDTCGVSDMSNMFSGCDSLTTVYVDKKYWNTENVNSSSDMFLDCNSLTGENGTKYAEAKIDDVTYARIDGLDGQPGYLSYSSATLSKTAWIENVNDSVGDSTKSLRSAVSFTRNTELTLEEVRSKEGAVKIDDGATEKSIYYWKDNDNKAYWWTDAKIAYFPADSSYLFYQCSELRELDASQWNTSKATDMQNIFCSCSKLAHINMSRFDTSNVTNMRSMFSGCSRLSSLNISIFDTGNVTNMMYMFNGCNSLDRLDVSGFDTGNVTNMYAMFNNCSGLTTLDVSGFKTGNVTNMYSMFSNCSGLTTLDVSQFDTGKVTNMYAMFNNCGGLTTLNVSKFDTSMVENMGFMFKGCGQLKNLDVSGFKTGRVKYMHSMFQECTSMGSLNLSKFDTSNVTTMRAMFYNCHVGSLDLRNFNTQNVNDMYFMFHSSTSLGSLDLSSFNTSKVTNMEGMFCNIPHIKQINLSNFDTKNVTTMKDMFSKCTELITVYAGNGWNTDKVPNSTVMFSGCSALVGGNNTKYAEAKINDVDYYERIAYAHIDGLDGKKGYFTHLPATISKELWRENVNDDEETSSKSLRSAVSFTRNRNLTLEQVQAIEGAVKIDDGTTNQSIYYWKDDDNNAYWWSDAKVVYFPSDSSYMFYKCVELNNLDLDTLNSVNVTNMSAMFSGCSKLTDLDIAMFNTKNVTDMGAMFNDCSNLANLDLTRIETDNVTNMSSMFSGCSSLTNLDVTKFSTEKVTDMSSMFSGCTSLTDIDVSNFITDKVIDMSSMFKGCSNIPELDLGYFKTVKVTDMGSMFSDCVNLVTIYADKYNWDTANVFNSADMFKNCTLLTGEKGTKYSVANVSDGSYACIDDPDNNSPGYFTFLTAVIDIDVWTTYVNDHVWNHYSMPLRSAVSFTRNTDLTIDEVKAIEGAVRIDDKKTNKSIYYWKDTSNKAYWWSDAKSPYFPNDCDGMFYGCYKLTKLDITGFITSNVTNMAYMFYGCPNLTLNLSYFDTQNVTNMGGMFRDSSLSSLNLSSFDTSNVTTMREMFRGCKQLTNLDLSNFNTQNVTDMYCMFQDCTNLRSVDVSNFNTNRVTNTQGMFANITSIPKLDLSNFDTKNVTTMRDMFNGCASLKTIFVGNSWNTDKVSDSTNMFLNCSVLVGEKGTSYATMNVTNKVYARIDDPDNNNPGYLTHSPATISKELWIENVNDDEETSSKSLRSAVSFTRNNAFTLEQVQAIEGAVKIDDGTTNQSIYYWKDDDNNAYWWSDAKVVYFPSDSSYMFYKCVELNNLDLDTLNSVNVTEMNSMFSGCSKLKKLDIIRFNTKNATDMSAMFNDCSNLANLDLTRIETDNVTNMSSIFSGCSSLTNLDVTKFSTEKVTDMSSMFSGCTSLTDIDVSNFITDNVIDMNSMFKGCSNIPELDLGHFKTVKVTDMGSMFSDCVNLVTIYVDKYNWDTANVFNSADMFKNCTLLTGEKGTKYSVANVSDGSYACIDDPDNNSPGYLTFLTAVIDIDAWTTYVNDHVWNHYSMPLRSAVSFTRNTDLTIDEVKAIEGAVRIDDERTNKSIYYWKDTSNKAYWWSDAKSPYFPNDCDGMFYGCNKLTKLDITGFITSNVTNMANMFLGCSGITFDLSHFDTQNVTNMYCMFRDCTNQVALSLHRFNTSKVTNMQGIFQNCKNLTSLDVSNFDTSNVKNMSYMFNNCNKLTTIFVGDKWNTSNVTSSNNMFANCNNLVGEQGTTYNSSYLDKTYARIDNPPDEPGYLTYKGSSADNTAVTAAVNFISSAAESFKSLSDYSTKSVPLAFSDVPDTVADSEDFISVNPYNGETENFCDNSGTYFTDVVENTFLPLAYAYSAVMSTASADTSSDSENTVSVNYTSKNEMYDPAVDGEDTDNVFEKWIDNGDGTWTYRFKVYDEDAEYYLWEGAMANYTSDHSADNPLKVTYEQGKGLTEDAVITNTKELRTSLTVRKDLAGNVTDADKNTEFTFNISLSDSLTGYYGDIKFISGNAEISLKGGEAVTAADLPAGLTYTVTEVEANQNDFITTSSAANGTLVENEGTIASFTNTKDTPVEPLPKTGDLEISKTVKSTDGGEPTDSDSQRDFLFTITLYDSEGNVDTNIDGLYGDVIFTSGTAQTSLKHNGSKKITGIPAGESYKVTEADYSKSFDCEKSGDTGTIAENTVQNAEFTNTKKQVATNGFTLTKKLLGVQPEKPFTFYIAFTGLEPMTVYTYTNGEFTSEKDGSADVIVELSPSESIHFDGLPVDSTYRITEPETKYISSYKITDSASLGSIVSAEKSNANVSTSLSTAVEKVDKDEDITVTFSNQSPSFVVGFSKKNSSASYINGAKLQALDEECNVIAEWESEGEEYTVSLPAGTYKLHEFKAPDGYSLAEDIPFSISETGELVWGEQTDGTSTYVEMIDNSTDVKISKQNGYNSTLSGAVLKLYEEVSDDNYQTVAQWTTGDGPKNFNRELNNALNIFTRYKLEEISAPDGYAKAQDIHFVLNGSGQVIINGELSRKQDGSYTVLGGTPAEDNLIVMNDYKKIVLPGSGSKGEVMFMLFGCLLFTAGCIYIGRYYLKRRRRHHK